MSPLPSERLSAVGGVWVPRLATRSFETGQTDCIGFLNLPLAPVINGDFSLGDDDTGLSEFAYNRAKSPVLCWQLEDGSDIFAHAQIFESNADGSLRALIFCHGPERIAGFRTRKDKELYEKVCVKDDMSWPLDTDVARTAMTEVRAPEEWSSDTIRIVKPAAEQELIEKLRAKMKTEPAPELETYTLANGVEARVTSYDSAGRKWSRVSFVVLSSGKNLPGYVFDDALSDILNEPAVTGLAENLLQAWFDRLLGSAGTRPKLFGVLEEADINLWLQGYGRKPDINTLDWVLAGGEAGLEAQPAIKVELSRLGTLARIRVDSDDFEVLPRTVLPFVDRATAEWPDVRKFEMILSEYDPVQDRRYFAIRPTGQGADDDGLLIAALVPGNDDRVAFLETYSRTDEGQLGAITLTTHGQLRCRIKDAHDRSAVSPLSAFRTAEIDPWKILAQPTRERQRLNLANDPIPAMFISRQEEGAC